MTDASGNVLTGNNAVVHADGTEYQLKQGNDVIAKFNIEKDSFVKSGEIVYGTYNSETGTFTPGQADTTNAFIHLAIKTTGDGDNDAAESDIYIPASSLIEYTTVADSDAYLTDNNHVITVSQKVRDAIATIEGLTVNGQSAASGSVTIDATQVPMSNAQGAQSVSDAIAAINTEIGDAAVAGESASTGLYKYVDDAIDALDAAGYDQVVNANESQYVKVSAKANNQQTLSVEIGSFTDGNTAQVPGLATVQAVETVITANEAVTSNALNALDARLDVLEAANPIADLDKSNNTSDAVAGVTVQVDESDGIVAKPVVTVADNAVTYTAASGNTAANLAAANTGNVLKGDAIAPIKSYVDAKVDALDATSNTSTAVAGITVQVDEVNGVVSTPVVTVANNTVTCDSTNNTLTAADTTAVLKGDAIAPIKEYIDDAVSDAQMVWLSDLPTA